MEKFIAVVVAAVLLTLAIIVGYNVTHETIPAGYVGYVYDRTAGGGDNVIEGTSVIDEARTGRIKINPITQTVVTHPSVVQSRNWTGIDEGDNKVDMSMQIASKEGVSIDTDVYISVVPSDVRKLIQLFGTKQFDDIFDNDVYGLTKGKLNSVSNKYSAYDIQAQRAAVQKEAFDILSEALAEMYDIQLVRFELGTLRLPDDIQEKINQKTTALNEVEIAKLEREKQSEINQQVVDQQKAQSEKEMLQRQTKADAEAYEIAKQAQAQIEAQKAQAEVARIKREEAEAAQKSQVEIARMKVEEAELKKEAELESQKTLTEAYFKDRELDIQQSAVKAVNGSLKTIVTTPGGEGFSAIYGLKEVLESME